MATTYHSAGVAPDQNGHNDSHAHVDPLRSYITVFIVLIILLLATIGAYCIPFEKVSLHGYNLGFVNTVIALTIAAVKSSLVLLVFMHLRHSTKLTWVFAAAGFIWLCIMVLFTFADYTSRGSVREIVKEPLDGITSITREPEPGNSKNNASWAN